MYILINFNLSRLIVIKNQDIKEGDDDFTVSDPL